MPSARIPITAQADCQAGAIIRRLQRAPNITRSRINAGRRNHRSARSDRQVHRAALVAAQQIHLFYILQS